MANRCCDQQAEPLSEVLDSAADDPALQSCCARDLKEQAYVARLKAELLLHDKTNTRCEIAAKAFDPRLNDLQDAESSQSDVDSDLEHDEGD